MTDQKPTPPPGQDRPGLKLPANCIDTTDESVRAGKVFVIVGEAGVRPVKGERQPRNGT
jgi:hypothetical protein